MSPDIWLPALTWTNVLFVIVIYSFATVVQSSTGFGSAVVAGPFLALIDPRFVPAPLILAGLTIAGLILIRDGLSGDKIEVALLTAGRVLGSLLGAWLLLSLSQNSLTLLFSGLLLAAAVTSAFGITVKRSRPVMAITGAASGLMGTVAGLGGAPVALVFQSERGAGLRSMLATYLIPGGVVTAIIIAVAGRITLYEIELYLLLLPGLAIGHLVTTSLKSHIDRYVSRWVVLAITVGGSGWLFLKTITTM